jgi:hypothetical protein
VGKTLLLLVKTINSMSIYKAAYTVDPAMKEKSVQDVIDNHPDFTADLDCRKESRNKLRAGTRLPLCSTPAVSGGNGVPREHSRPFQWVEDGARTAASVVPLILRLIVFR